MSYTRKNWLEAKSLEPVLYDRGMYRVIAAATLLVCFTLLFLNGTDSVPSVATVAASESTDASLLQPLQIQVPVTAKAYAVIDMESGQVVTAANADTVYPIASITKLFTAAEALKHNPLPLTITAADVATHGRAGKLAAGDEYTTYELLYPLLLESSNDAAAAIERAYGVPAVAAVELADSSGLSVANQASAETLARSLQRLYDEVPHVFDISRIPQFISPKNGWVNNSPVRTLPGYQGGKHGYTDAARSTLAAVFTESALDDHALGYVILGSDDVAADVSALRTAVVAALSEA